MSEPVRVPDPVAQKARTQAEREDISVGAVIREWMEKAEKFEEASRR